MAEKPKYPIPVDDDLRVQVLHDLNILDTVDEERFGELIRELSETLHAPIAYLSLIDAERQWLKAKVGPIDREVDREHAFCSHVILGSDPVVVADATQDPRFASSPLVTASPNLRFYACVPIADRATGQRIGTVCIADQKPRELTARELAILEGFASRVADEVNARPMVFVAYAAADLDWVQRPDRPGRRPGEAQAVRPLERFAGRLRRRSGLEAQTGAPALPGGGPAAQRRLPAVRLRPAGRLPAAAAGP